MYKYIKASVGKGIEAVENLQFDGKDLRDFITMLGSVRHSSRYAQYASKGNWEIGTGGYDEWYFINYYGIEVISCVDGVVEQSYYTKSYSGNEAIEQYAQLFADEYEFDYAGDSAYRVYRNTDRMLAR